MSKNASEHTNNKAFSLSNDDTMSMNPSASEVTPMGMDMEDEEVELYAEDMNLLGSQPYSYSGSGGVVEGETSDELYEHYRAVADPGQQLLRVDKFLINLMHDTSRNRIQAAADAGCIHVNGRAVKRNYRVKPGDVVTLMLTRPRFDSSIKGEDIPLEIVYEDDQLMVINKPAGMVVHPGCGNYSGTLVNAIAWHLRDNPDYDPNDPTVGLVHRIDKDTSGLLVVGKRPRRRRIFVLNSSRKPRVAATMPWFGEIVSRRAAALRATLRAIPRIVCKWRSSRPIVRSESRPLLTIP